MAVGLRFDGVDNEVVIPDSADWDMGDTEDLSIAFWAKIHPDLAADADFISRVNWWRFGLKSVEHDRLRPYFTLSGGETVYFRDVEEQGWLVPGRKHHIGLVVTSPAILDGNRTAAADTNTVNHLLDADGTDWTTVAAVGDIAFNVTDNTYGTITDVAAHDLTLDTDAFPDGNEVYLIIDAGSLFSVALYVDGVLRETETFADYAVWPAAAATAIYFGSYNSASEFFLGDANELVITPDVVTAAEMVYLYNDGVEIEDIETGGITDDIGHWSFDEGTGATVDEDGGTVGKDGTIAGTELWLTTLDIGVKDNALDLPNQGDYFQGWLKIARVQWLNPTNATHLLSLTNWDGNPVFDWRSATADQSVDVAHPVWADGVKVDDLDSGAVRLLVE